MPRPGIGGGFIARFHIKSWIGVRDADILGVFDPDAKRAREACALVKSLGVGEAKPFASITEMAADPRARVFVLFLGLVDDLVPKGIGYKRKFLVQALAALIVTYFGIKLTFVSPEYVALAGMLAVLAGAVLLALAVVAGSAVVYRLARPLVHRVVVGMVRVSVRPFTGSVLCEYDPAELDRHAILAAVEAGFDSVGAELDKVHLRAALQEAMRLAAHKLPIFVVGWQEDFADPQDWLVPFASTGGNYTTWANIPKDITAKFDPFIQQGVAASDFATRDKIYKQFNQVFYEEATELPMVLATTQMYFQRWDQGLTYNPLYGWLYYYPLSKN